MKIERESRNAGGCVYINYHFDELSLLHDAILREDVRYDIDEDSFGLEYNPHVTLVYGLHPSVGVTEISPILENYTFTTVKIHTPSLFRNEGFDVLKFDVSGYNLTEIHQELKKLPNESKYPKYTPHLTIGYLKSGRGDKYVRLFKEQFNDAYFISPKYAVFSDVYGDETKINITID